MGLLNWLMGRAQSESKASAPSAGAPAPVAVQTPSGKDVCQSPSLLSRWVETYFLKGIPSEHYDELLPSADIRKDLNITVEQRERCVREYVVLRVAGILHFVKEHYPDSFYVSFSRDLSSRLRSHLYPDGGLEAETLAQALEDYVVASEGKDVDQCAGLYLRGVYDDNDNFFKLKFGGVGFISVEYIASGYEIFHDAYYQMTQGKSYTSIKVIAEALEKVKGSK